MKNTLHIAKNALDPSEWETHESDRSIAELLLEHFPERFPETGRIFHQYIATEKDVTPTVSRPESVQYLASLTGTFWVIVYPAGPALAFQFGSTALLTGGLLVASSVVSWLTRPDKKPPPPKLQPITGSPNNKLGDRVNTARPQGRIPDIFGTVRSTPDLIQAPYTVYVDHRETEICYFCVGKGDYIITDIREGDMLVNQIDGMSVAVYEPGTIPGSGSPVDQVGPVIDDPVYIVRTVEAVNGQPMLAPNAHTFLGDIPAPGSNLWFEIEFRNVTAGQGEIHVGGTADEILEKVKTGDKLDIIFPSDRLQVGEGLNPLNETARNPLDKRTGSFKTAFDVQNKLMRLTQNGTGPMLDLTGTGANAVTVLNVDPTVFWNIAVSIPPAMQTAWDAIDTFTAGLFAQGEVGNGGCLITPQDHDWVGPFFVENPIAAPQEQLIVCNFVAQDGLYADDGKSLQPFNIRIEVEITPADANGVPTGGPVQLVEGVLLGSIASRNTRGLTMKIVPVTQGNFLIRARRLTRTPWKQDSPTHNVCLVLGRTTGYSGNVVPALAITGDRVGKNKSDDADPNAFYEDPLLLPPLYKNSSFLPFYGNSHDEVRWTHCFSLTTIPVISLGDITTIHTRTVATEGATRIQQRRLSCIAKRQIQTWNGVTFGGALVDNNLCENVLFTILKDPLIGNLTNDLIDFAGIVAAFASVRAAFGGPTSDGFGGDEAGQFNYTFDNEDISLEDTIAIICQAGFCVPYREGDVLKVKPELATTDAQLVVNHRNKLPGSEQRTINFGTEAEFDGVRLEYTEVDINNPTNDAIKTYSIPPNNVALRPKIIEVPGIRLKKHAAWHAWRAYNKLLYQNRTVQFEACQEAMRLKLMDRFLLSDDTRAHGVIQAGEVTAISGLTITTSQPVDTNGNPHTIFLQHTNGTVESIAVASNPNDRQLTLATPPSVALVTDQSKKMRTLYLMVQNAATVPKAFLVQERYCTGKGTYSITATNYSHSYYWNDGLMFWLPFVVQSGLLLHRDWGPYELSTSSSGSSAVDPDRGSVYSGVAAGDFITITTSNVFASQSYTKAAWVNWDGGVASSIISSVEDNDEQFFITAGGTLVGAHNGVGHCQEAGFPSGVWTHVALSYNHVTQVMTMFINGENVSQATSVPGRGIGNLRIFGGFSGVDDFRGKGDEVRYWMRVLSEEEIRELFHKTRL